MFRRAFARWAGDPALVLAVLLMTVFGIAMIYSAGVLNIPSSITEGAWVRQSRWFAIALVAFTGVSQLRYLQAKAMDCRKPADAYKLTGRDRWEAIMRCLVIVRKR